MSNQAENSDNNGKAFNMSADDRAILEDFKDELFKTFRERLSQELDIEPALREFCDWLRNRLSPCNMALFLPGTSGDYNLGAYINCDIGKENCEVLFDTMAGHVDRHFLKKHNKTAMYEDIPLLEGYSVLHAAATVGDEVFASVVAFVDSKKGFRPSARHYMEGACQILAKQLKKIIETHNRHRPKSHRDVPGNGFDPD